MKTNINDKYTYMAPFVMTLAGILRLHHGTSLVEICLLQAEAPRSRQNTVSFNIIKEEFDLVFGPPAGLLKVFGCTASGGRSITGSRR